MGSLDNAFALALDRIEQQSLRHNRVAQAFSTAADYDRHAGVQQRVAHRLARHIAAISLPECPRVLEIGCGTGFLTAACHNSGVVGDWLATDISPMMLERCRQRMGNPTTITYGILDGGNPEIMPAASFDLICSSLAFQWFDDLNKSLARLLDLLAPGGHLVFTTLGSNTFFEWKQAHRAIGRASGTPHYPEHRELIAMQPLDCQGRHWVDHYVVPYANARHFLRALKSIGAGTPRPDHHPLHPGELRQVMDRFEKSGGRATYEVVTGHYTRPLHT